MLAKLTKRKVVMGICLSSSLKEEIDKKRGDIPRSTFIYRILERQIHENNVENKLNESSPLARQNSAASLHFPNTTRLGDSVDG